MWLCSSWQEYPQLVSSLLFYSTWCSPMWLCSSWQEYPQMVSRLVFYSTWCSPMWLCSSWPEYPGAVSQPVFYANWCSPKWLCSSCLEYPGSGFQAEVLKSRLAGLQNASILRPRDCVVGSCVSWTVLIPGGVNHGIDKFMSVQAKIMFCRTLNRTSI